MRTIVAGGRDFKDHRLMHETLTNLPWEISEVVCGLAKGADRMGYLWAEEAWIDVAEFPANWHKNGKRAGPIRNAEMAEYAEALVAFWDGESKGTRNMIDTAVAKGLIVKVVRYGTGAEQ